MLALVPRLRGECLGGFDSRPGSRFATSRVAGRIES
nr:MAG TPA: Protein of unknown function (DUF3005) [Caudoviricetes sp.]